MLNWSSRFNIFCLLDDQTEAKEFDCLLGAGVHKSLESVAGSAFNKLDSFRKEHSDWMFGHMGYGLKIECEEINDHLIDRIEFPDLYFFVPKVVFILKGHALHIGSVDQLNDIIYEDLQAIDISTSKKQDGVVLNARTTRDEYLADVNSLLNHIRRGDCYEINYCQEFYAEQCVLDPVYIYEELSRLSPSPFAAFYQIDGKYLICGSPERFLKKSGDKIVSQPIKGTAARDTSNSFNDRTIMNELLGSQKERSENIMVTDLVRNDLSKICKEGTVQVEELVGLYTFAHVHQLISTISGLLSTDDLSKIFKAVFPMGSMTGAPKKRVMELIDTYEKSGRGLYSGAVGYITPNMDFDFNVVIRSILYNKYKKYVSVHVGSGITINSEPTIEFEECNVKIAAARKVLSGGEELF